MKNQNEPLNLFTEQAFEPRNIEQSELVKAKTNLGKPGLTISYMGIDCVYYVGAGNCAAHGEMVDCIDCDDYKPIDGDEVEDDD